MSNLLPCPFCGSTDIDSEPNTDTYGSVCCNKCGFGSPYGEISIMIEHWNSRPLEDALLARIAELERQLQSQIELHETWLGTYRLKLDYIDELENKLKRSSLL